MIFTFEILNIILLDLRNILKTYYRFNHKESILRVLSNADENSGQNNSSILFIENLLNAESIKLWNNNMKSDPKKQKLLYADYFK